MKLISLAFFTLLFQISSTSIIKEIVEKFPYETLLILGEGNIRTSRPRIVGNGLESFNLHENFNANLLTIVFLRNLMQIQHLQEFLNENILSRIIIILKNSTLQKEEIFKICWTQNLSNVVLLTEDRRRTELFTYSPFKNSPNLTIQRLSSPYGEVSRNYHSFPFTFGGVIFELEELPIFRFVVNILDYMKQQYNINISYSKIDPDFIFVISVLYQDRVEDPRKTTSYFELDKFNVVVPRTIFIDKSSYYTLPFQVSVWATICVYYIFGSLALYTIERVSDEDTDFISNLMECLRITLSQTILLRPQGQISSFINIVMIVVGFLLVNLYGLYLGYFLIKDVETGNFKIAYTIGNDDDFFEGSGFKFVYQDPLKYASNLYNLNTKFGYIVNSYLWNSHHLRHKFRLLKKDMKGGSFPILGMMRKNCILETIFDNFVINAYSSGLYRRWIQEAVGFGFQHKKHTFRKRKYLLYLSDIKLPLELYLFGIFAAFSCFVFEILFVKIYNKF